MYSSSFSPIDETNEMPTSEVEYQSRVIQDSGLRGSSMNDYQKKYDYIMKLYNYDHPEECMQHTPNFIQTNIRDVRLPDTDLVNIESELRGITRNISRIPESRYLGPGSCSQQYNDKGICVCPSCLKSNVVNQNPKECSTKIVNNLPKVNYTSVEQPRALDLKKGINLAEYKVQEEPKGLISYLYDLIF